MQQLNHSGPSSSSSAAVEGCAVLLDAVPWLLACIVLHGALSVPLRRAFGKSWSNNKGTPVQHLVAYNLTTLLVHDCVCGYVGLR